MNVEGMIIEVLSRGDQSGAALYEEVCTRWGVPSMTLWRETLIALDRNETIERHVIRDDDDEVIEVIYKLHHEAGVQNEQR